VVRATVLSGFFPWGRHAAYVALIGYNRIIFSELVYGAFKEAGFLADDRPLKVRP
jgi:hypothetical protein